MAVLNFDATQIDTSSHDPVQPGTYEAVITESETRPCRNGQGLGINLTFEILSESAKGRKVWNWINYMHPKQEAQRIGQEELARLCKALGIARLGDTVEMHNIPLMITVALDKDDPTRNVIKKVAPKASSAAPAASVPTAAQTAVLTSGSAPWAR